MAAWWNEPEQTHPAHADPDPAVPGDPGASQPAGPGPDDGPATTRCCSGPPWPAGPAGGSQRADGDRRASARLQFIESQGVIVLNDRRIPGSRSSIKFIAVSSVGRLRHRHQELQGPGPHQAARALGRPRARELHVGRRNCTGLGGPRLPPGGRSSATASSSTPWGSEVPVQALLCLTRADWGFASAIEISDVWVGWPQLMAGRVQAPGVMDSPTVQEVSEMIVRQLPWPEAARLGRRPFHTPHVTPDTESKHGVGTLLVQLRVRRQPRRGR